MLCVADGIPNSVPVQLHAHHLLCPATGGQADGANAAVGIQHHLFAGQAGGFHSQTIQHLGLVMVDLVEAPGAQGIGLTAEGIQNEALAVEHLFLFAQHHAGAAGVVVLHHGGHGDMALFGFGQQSTDKVFRPGQNRLGCHQYHHHLPGHHTAPQQAVAEQAGALILIVRLVAAGAGRRPHRLHHGVQHFVLQQAAFHRQHFMRACRIDAGHQFPAGARCKGRDHLIAVMAGVFRAPDGSHRAVFSHQLTDSSFFLFQLLGIIQPQHRTAAALFCF